MAPRPRKRARRSNPKDSRIPQLPSQQLRNPMGPLEPLDEEQIELLHTVSLEILEDQGIEVMGQQALELFRNAGAEVDQAGIVRMDRGLVIETVAKAPGPFSITPRNEARAIYCGDNAINFGLVSGPPNVHDCVNGRRAGNMADYEKIIKLGQHFNVLTFFGNQAIAPTDLPANNRHLDTLYSNLTHSDKPFAATGIGAGRALDAITMCAISLGKSIVDMTQQTSVMTNININSPRKLDDSMAYGAMQMALLGQAVSVTPFTLMGAMTPATMAGALAQQNAEALLGVCLIQLTRSGAPVIYGGFTSNVDMRSGAPAFGTPENSLANMAGGQLARRYGLPYRTSGCNASNTVDGQAVWETQMSLWSAVMGHGNLVYHAAGWLEGGLVASFEKLVMDCEMIQHMSHMLKPVKITREEIGVEAMAEVGPGGHFFGCDHTMQRFKDAFYQPFLSDWQNHESWVLSGAENATQRATKIWQKALAEYEAPAVDPAITEELQDHVARAKLDLGRNEPTLEPVYF
ncbi:MAG: trimethylamine--corrinoid protein Co-methyltransferase [Flavobacteriaceae bacterium]|jgi:trimethylamine--corrinoid protein Co-methyltransferase